MYLNKMNTIHPLSWSCQSNLYLRSAMKTSTNPQRALIQQTFVQTLVEDIGTCATSQQSRLERVIRYSGLQAYYVNYTVDDGGMKLFMFQEHMVFFALCRLMIPHENPFNRFYEPTKGLCQKMGRGKSPMSHYVQIL